MSPLQVPAGSPHARILGLGAYRPSRIIPRAEVYTSGDVTIEELRGEGEEPRLSAADLAERIGHHFQGEDEES